MKIDERYGGVPDQYEMKTLDQPLYSMIRDSPSSCWHYILGRMAVYRDSKAVLCSLGLSYDGCLICGVNFDRFLFLSTEGRKAMFRYLCLRLTLGHLSTAGEKLKERYGHRIFDTASCLTIDQHTDLFPLWEDGFIVPGVHMYGLPENLDTQGYCELLKGREDAKKAKNPQGSAPFSLQDMMLEMLRGMDQQNPDVQERMRAVFGESYDPSAGWDPDADDDPFNLRGDKEPQDSKVKVVAPPGTSQKDILDLDTPDGTTRKWELNAPPDWIKNGKVDEELFNAAVARGEIDPQPFCDTFMGPPPELADLVAKKILVDAINHTDIKSQGWFKGECEEFIDALLREPVIGWVTLIRRRERTHISRLREATRRRPSRRHSAYWGRHPSKNCRIYAFIDTSMSMQKRELSCVGSELHGLVSRGSTVYVGQIDADMQQEPVLFDGSVNLEEFFGRGGTDFRPAFDWMATQSVLPDFVVYFTDGCGTAPEQPPAFMHELDILWVLTADGMTPDDFRKNVCAYGEVVVMDTVSGIDDDAIFNE